MEKKIKSFTSFLILSQDNFNGVCKAFYNPLSFKKMYVMMLLVTILEIWKNSFVNWNCEKFHSMPFYLFSLQ